MQLAPAAGGWRRRAPAIQAALSRWCEVVLATKRHEHRGDAGGAQLAHRDRAGAADDQVALGETRRHVVDEGQHLGVDAGRA